MKRVVAPLLLTILAIPARAQTGFEVASIRLSQPGAGPAGSRFYFRGDRFEAKTATVGNLMSLLMDRFKLQSHKETREVPDHETYSVRSDGQGHFIFTATPLSALTNFLSQQTHVPVTDETDLKGAYNFVVATVDVQPQPGEDWSDRVREAVEALGFQVESRRVSLEITVVDRCERPGEN